MSLVAVSELLGFLREPEGGTEEDELQALLDQLEARLLIETNRVDVPFAFSEEADRVEYHDGTGGNKLWLDYPISDISTDVLLGLDPDDPDDELDPTDKTELRWQAGQRCLQRVDGGKFGERGKPLYVKVTYDAQPDRTLELDAARLGIMRQAAQIWRQRGSEDLTSGGLGELRFQLEREPEPAWTAAVATCRRMSVF